LDDFEPVFEMGITSCVRIDNEQSFLVITRPTIGFTGD